MEIRMLRQKMKIYVRSIISHFGNYGIFLRKKIWQNLTVVVKIPGRVIIKIIKRGDWINFWNILTQTYEISDLRALIGAQLVHMSSSFTSLIFFKHRTSVPYIIMMNINAHFYVKSLVAPEVKIATRKVILFVMGLFFKSCFPLTLWRIRIIDHHVCGYITRFFHFS